VGSDRICGPIVTVKSIDFQQRVKSRNELNDVIKCRLVSETIHPPGH
jgi:hypothetical protein